MHERRSPVVSAHDCPDGVSFATLVDYWLDATDDAPLDAHVLACDACTTSLEWLAALADAIPDVVRRGETLLIMPDALLARLRAQGAQVREYRLRPGASVNCTIAPADDVVVAHLEAHLAGATRIDLVATSGNDTHRAVDIPFDPARESIVLASRTRDLRALGRVTFVARLVAVDAHGEREIGRYTFHHAPFDGVAS
jgi:hypothetical protein